MSIEFDANGQFRDAPPSGWLGLLCWVLISALCVPPAMASADEWPRPRHSFGPASTRSLSATEPLEDARAANLVRLPARASALETGNASRLASSTKRILADRTQFLGVRVEMGAPDLALGDYARASSSSDRHPDSQPSRRHPPAGRGLRKLAENTSRAKRRWPTLYGVRLRYDSNLSARPCATRSRSRRRAPRLPPASFASSSNYNGSLAGESSIRCRAVLGLCGWRRHGPFYNQLDTANYMNVDLRTGIAYGAAGTTPDSGSWRPLLPRSPTLRDSAGANVDYRFLANDATRSPPTSPPSASSTTTSCQW